MARWQGDQMSLLQNRPKCGPTRFFIVKTIAKLLPWMKVEKKLDYFRICQKTYTKKTIAQ
jgi:hypothetical protein